MRESVFILSCDQYCSYMKLMSFCCLTNIYWWNSKMTPISYDYDTEYMAKWEYSLAWYDVAINSTMKTCIHCCKRARAFAYYSSPRIRCIAFWERAVHTFSGLSGRLDSSGLSAHASEFTTERPEVSNYLPIQRCLLRAIYSSLLWPQISIACTRAYVVDDVWDTAVVHICNEIVFDCAIL